MEAFRVARVQSKKKITDSSSHLMIYTPHMPARPYPRDTPTYHDPGRAISHSEIMNTVVTMVTRPNPINAWLNVIPMDSRGSIIA